MERLRTRIRATTNLLRSPRWRAENTLSDDRLRDSLCCLITSKDYQLSLLAVWPCVYLLTLLPRNGVHKRSWEHIFPPRQHRVIGHILIKPCKLLEEVFCNLWPGHKGPSSLLAVQIPILHQTIYDLTNYCTAYPKVFTKFKLRRNLLSRLPPPTFNLIDQQLLQLKVIRQRTLVVYDLVLAYLNLLSQYPPLILLSCN